MSCRLMHVNGLAAECTKSSCIYWASPTSRAGMPQDTCALEHFRLLGQRPDRLAFWLLELKFKDEIRPQALRSA